MNLLDTAALRSHVIAELTSIGGKLRGDEVIILCPFHNDRTPSLGVHVGHKITPGAYHCFSCKAHGGWNTLADALKLKKVDYAAPALKPENQENPFQMAQQIFKNIATKENYPTLQGIEDLPPKFSWRELSFNFLKKLNAQYFWKKENGCYYLYFPLTMNREYKGYTLCALNRERSNQKYLIFGDSSKLLFLYDQIITGSSVVLVEGHYDALRLQNHGIPAVAIFGTSNWSAIQKSYLASKCPKKVIVLMDGDQSGHVAAKRIFEDLRSGFNVQVLPLPITDSKLDPGNMPIEYLDALRNYL